MIKMTPRIVIIVLVILLLCSFTVYGANNEDAIGDPVTDTDEGSFNYVYWRGRISGSGATCWTDLQYGQNANTIKTKLVITRSLGLWIPYDYHTVTNTEYNDNYVYSRWDDGVSYVALAATGTGYINGTEVFSLFVNGWW